MQMFPVNVRCDDRLVSLSQQAAGKFHADGMGLLRRNLARCVRMDEVITQHTAAFAPAPFRRLHFRIGGPGVAVDAVHQHAGSLFLICDVVQRHRQVGFLRVLHIVHAVIQPRGDRDDLVIRHHSASLICECALRRSAIACCSSGSDMLLRAFAQ